VSVSGEGADHGEWRGDGAAVVIAPRRLALQILAARFRGDSGDRVRDPELADFQKDAVARLDAALRRYDGALLADSVGLGKTYVGAALARRALAAGAEVQIVVPPVLRRQWQHVLRDDQGAGARVRIISHAALSRLPASHPGGNAAFVVVDEAHAFRNPATRRYRALAALTRHARVLLITATPVNNSLADLYWLLRLFAGDAAFADIGVPDLRTCFAHAQRTGSAGRIPSVLARVMVRRTRSLLLDVHGGLDFGSAQLAFPRRDPPVPIHYPAPRSWRVLLQLVEDLELSGWSEGGRGAALLLRMLLLRRAESSRAAAVASFRALDAALVRMLEALAHGLDPRGAGRRPEVLHQLALDALLLPRLPVDADASGLAESCRRDRERIAQLMEMLASEPDAKLAALVALLRSMCGRPVVLFTEFRDTAVALHRALHRDFRSGLIHGAGAFLGIAPAGRRTVIECFAPRANGARSPPARERVQVLIATDILAEGLNLHDAADVISFDLPWNPVRLIQRIGRIDRLGSRHERIRSHHFVPARELERTLGVMRRLRRKLHAIGCALGVEDAILGADEQRVLGALRGDAAALDTLERREALTFDVEERLRAALVRARSENPVALPLLQGLATESTPRFARGSLPVACVDAAFPLPAELRRGKGPVAIVFTGETAAQRAWLVRGRIVVEDDATAGAALLASLDRHAAAEITDVELRTAAIAARLASRQCRPADISPVTVGILAPLRRRLLALLERVPGGASAEECRRVESVLRHLDLSAAGTELELRRRRRELRSLDLAGLCDTLETMLSGTTEGISGAGDGIGDRERAMHAGGESASRSTSEISTGSVRRPADLRERGAPRPSRPPVLGVLLVRIS
jgi:superfamily II DNA or RNA helicase